MGKKCFMNAAIIANVSFSLKNYENERGKRSCYLREKCFQIMQY